MEAYGYSINLTGMEPLPAQFVTGSTATSAFGAVANAPTVVTGSAA